MSGQEFKDIIDEIKGDLMRGVLTYDEAKEKISVRRAHKTTFAS